MKTQKNLIKSLSLIVFVLIVAISCDNRPTAPIEGTTHKNHSLLLGTWENNGSSYTETYIYSYGKFDGGSYKMNVGMIIWSSDTSGIIYGKYTENSYYKDVVGKYYAVSFKDLTESSISISGAYKQNGKTGTATLEEAISEFTIDNGYFGTYSACERKQ